MEEWNWDINGGNILQREKDSVHDICIGKGAELDLKTRRGDREVCCFSPYCGR